MDDKAHDHLPNASDGDRRKLASKVREACVAAALEAYENAKVSGLCEEGAWEVAVGAMREVNLDQFLEEPHAQDSR